MDNKNNKINNIDKHNEYDGDNDKYEDTDEESDEDTNEDDKHIDSKILEYMYDNLIPINEELIDNIIEKMPEKIYYRGWKGLIPYVFKKITKLTNNYMFYVKYNGIFYYKKDDLVIPDYKNKYMIELLSSKIQLYKNKLIQKYSNGK